MSARHRAGRGQSKGSERIIQKPASGNESCSKVHTDCRKTNLVCVLRMGAMIMFMITILTLILSGNWYSLSGGGRVFLAGDHIAMELGVDFDFDLIAWSGLLEGGKPSGYGVLRCYQNNRLMMTYRGHMLEGKMQDTRGIHTVYGANMKCRYVGGLVDGLRQGEGRMQWASATGKFEPTGAGAYTGQWMNNDFNGQGVYEENWKRYEGGFRNGRYHGQGKMFEMKRGDDNGSPAAGKSRLVKEGRWSNGTYIGKEGGTKTNISNSGQ